VVEPPAGRFCPYCGATNDPEYRFCFQCRRPLPGEPPPAAVPSLAAAVPPGPVPTRPQRRFPPWWVVAVAVLVAGIALAGAFLVPVPMTFSLTITSHGLSAATTYRTFPANSVVSFHWNTSNGASVTFELENSEGTTLGQSTGQAGNCTFAADGNPYGFVSSSVFLERVTVTGNYAAPVLP
jgi:hypothetical protein